MSLIDSLKSGAESLIGTTAQKFGLDPAKATAQFDALLADHAPAPSAVDADTPSAVAPDTNPLLAKINTLLDRDGDGNAMNDIKAFAGNILNREP